MVFNDIEFIVILLVLACFYFVGLRKRGCILEGRFTGIDLPTSAALKGIACVFILMGHYVSHREGVVETSTFSRMIQCTTANIALAIFMFFSGFGLSLKRVLGAFLPIWFKRMKKVYIPLLLTCVVAIVVYIILPDRFSMNELESMGMPKDIWYLHHYNQEYISALLPRVFGWKDWYVFCIMIFYSFYYLSKFLTRRKTRYQTLALWLMFVIYYICAYLYFGPPEAHWYRYCWAFFLGHIYAKMVQSNVVSKWDLVMFTVLFATILMELLTMITSYFIAILILIISAKLNKKYIMNSKPLAFMGGISYFFYLSHGRIGYFFIVYSGLYSVILWVIVTIVISLILSKVYEGLQNTTT